MVDEKYLYLYTQNTCTKQLSVYNTSHGMHKRKPTAPRVIRGWRNKMSSTQNATKIAKSSRPYAVVFQYDIGAHEQGEIISTHKSYDLARAAAKRSGYDSFLSIHDARDYA